MERITPQRGITGGGLRAWAFLFLAAGVFGRGILQARVLGVGTVSAQALFEAMNASPAAMTMATVSLVLQALEVCAVPIFAFLVVEGVSHTESLSRYVGRVALLALVCEVPYQLAFTGKIWNTASHNPVLGVALCLVMIWFFRRYPEKSLGHRAVKVLVFVAAMLWALMLRVDCGVPMVILAAAFWLTREKEKYRLFAGAIAAALCMVVSPFYLAAPMGILPIHFYNGEPGELSRPVKYLLYPAILLVVALAGMVM